MLKTWEFITMKDKKLKYEWIKKISYIKTFYLKIFFNTSKKYLKKLIKI